MNRYQKRTYTVPAEHEDAFAAELVGLGALGCEVGGGAAGPDDGRLTVEVWFPDPPPPALDDWDPGPWDAAALGRERVDERDWLAEYRAAARPLVIGRRFVVDPRDEEESAAAADIDGRIRLRIPARTAFGTGSHASTRLVLEWLEDLVLDGRDVLDVGTGSGLLAFAALRLGARRALAFDVDAGAVLVARANARLNGFPAGRPRFWAGRLAALGPAGPFDLALVNVLPEKIADDLPRLSPLLGPGGLVVSSGNLWSDRERLLDRWSAAGFELRGEKRDAEWAAFLLCRP